MAKLILKKCSSNLVPENTPIDTHKIRKLLFPQLETTKNPFFLKINFSKKKSSERSLIAFKKALRSPNAFFLAKNIHESEGVPFDKIFFFEKSHSPKCKSFPQLFRKQTLSSTLPKIQESKHPRTFKYYIPTK